MFLGAVNASKRLYKAIEDKFRRICGGANRLMFDVFLMFLVLNGLIATIVSFLLYFICLMMNINVDMAKWHTTPYH